MMTESHFQKNVRQGIEGNINHSYEDDDGFRVNELLGLWPYGRTRKEISLHQAHEIARTAIRRKDPYEQPTESFEAVST